MESCILPFQKQTPIMSYQAFAFPLGIALAHREIDVLPWLYSNFIQFRYRRDSPMQFCFEYTWFGRWPFFYFQIVDRDTIRFSGGGDLDWIRSCLRNQTYIITNVNERYHPKRAAYQKADRIHDILIFGCQEGAFWTAGYTPKGYEVTCVDEKAMRRMLESAGNQFRFMARVEETYHRDVNLYFIRDWMRDYVNPSRIQSRTCLYGSPAADTAYGVDVYDALMEYCVDCVERQIPMDIRYIGVFMEHKRIMSERIQYLQEKGYVSNRLHPYFQQIEFLSGGTQKEAIRYNAMGLRDVIKPLRERFEEMRRRELELWPQVIQELEAALLSQDCGGGSNLVVEEA